MESEFSNAWFLGANLAEAAPWKVRFVWRTHSPTGVEEGCPSLWWDIKLSWMAAGMEEKMASFSRRERLSVLRGSYFSLREAGFCWHNECF